MLLICSKLSQKLVFADPLNMYYLLLLGCSNFELAEFFIEKKQGSEAIELLLEESKNILSICMNNNPKGTNETQPAAFLTGNVLIKANKSLKTF